MDWGRVNFRAAVLLCLLAVVITAFVFATGLAARYYNLSYGALALAAIHMLIAIVIWRRSAPDPTREEMVMLYMHAMAFVASANGSISDNARSAIDSAVSKYTGPGFMSKFPNEALTQMGSNAPEDLEGYSFYATRTSDRTRQSAVEHALIVARADGSLPGSGGQRVRRVAIALRFSEEELPRLFPSLRENRSSIETK